MWWKKFMELKFFKKSNWISLSSNIFSLNRKDIRQNRKLFIQKYFIIWVSRSTQKKSNISNGNVKLPLVSKRGTELESPIDLFYYPEILWEELGFGGAFWLVLGASQESLTLNFS